MAAKFSVMQKLDPVAHKLEQLQTACEPQDTFCRFSAQMILLCSQHHLSLHQELISE